MDETNNVLIVIKIQEQIDELNADLEKLNKNMTNLKKDGKDTSDTFKKMSSETAVLRERLKTLNQEQRLNAQIANTQEGSIKRLSAELALNRFKWEQMTAAQREANKQMLQTIQSQHQQVSELEAQTGKMQRNVGNYSAAVGGLVQNLKAWLLGYVGIQAAMSATKEIFEQTKQLNSLNLSYKAIYESTNDYYQETARLRKMSRDYGLEIMTLREEYLKFSAAVKGSKMQGEESIRLFESVGKASAVLGLGSERLHLVYLALQQMVSKGRIQSEELRRQLGESLPGAFRIMAQAIGVTEAKLNDMLTKGEVMAQDVLPKFGAALEKAYGIENLTKVENLAAAQGRYKTIITETIDQMDRAGTFTTFFTFLSNATIRLTNLGTIMRQTFGINLTEKQYDKALIFAETESGKKVADLITPFDKMTNQYIKDHASQVKAYFMAVFEAEGEGMEVQEGLWKAYYKRRMDDAKVMNEKDKIPFKAWTEQEKKAKLDELARLKKHNQEMLEEQEDFNGKRSEQMESFADRVAAMDKKLYTDELNKQIQSNNLQMEYEMLDAEREIKDKEQLELRKLEISLKYAKINYQLAVDLIGVNRQVTDEQLEQLNKLYLAIEKIEVAIGNLKDTDTPAGEKKKGKLRGILGLSDEDLIDLRQGADTARGILNELQNYSNVLRDNEQNRLDRDYEREENRINKSHQSAVRKKRQLEQLDKEYRYKKYQQDLKEFETNRAFALTMAMVNTALAVTNALTTGDSFSATARAIAVALEGGISIAAILAEEPPQPPAYKKGGLPPIKGQSGTLIRVNEDGQQEAMMTAGAVRMFPRTLNALNIAGGGDPLFGNIPANNAAGEILTQYQLENALNAAISNMPPNYVSWKEFKEFEGKMTLITERGRA